MTPTEILKNEHEIILLVLGAAEGEAEAIRKTGRMDAERVRKMVEFFRRFSDAGHHAKEEKTLFPTLEARGMPREGGPIGVMLAEHDEGRRLVSAVAAALDGADRGDASAPAAAAESLAAFVALLREHIEKENHCLFPMADQALTAEDQAALSAAFDRIEREGAGEGERYRRLAHEIAGR